MNMNETNSDEILVHKGWVAMYGDDMILCAHSDSDGCVACNKYVSAIRNWSDIVEHILIAKSKKAIQEYAKDFGNVCNGKKVVYKKICLSMKEING